MPTTRVDPHIKILDEAIVDRAKARGLDVLVYAPHFTRFSAARRRAKRLSDEDLLVVPAREIFAGNWRNRKHVLALGLSDPIPDFITLDAAMEELARQDAVVLVPHPEFLTVSLDSEDVNRYEDLIDGVEIYNPKHLPMHNQNAAEIAAADGFEVFGSSYAHLPPTVGEVWTAFDREIASEAALLQSFRDGADRQVRRRDDQLHDIRRLREFAHLGWENTWKKFERIFLAGTEPTHPRHIAYNGRFDDVAVY